MPYFPAVYVYPSGRIKAVAISANDFKEALEKAKQKKEEKNLVKVVLVKNIFDEFFSAVGYAKKVLAKKVKKRLEEEAMAAEKVEAPEATGEELGKIDLSETRKLLPAILAGISEQVYSLLRKRRVKAVQVLLKVKYWNGSEELQSTDVEFEKEDESEGDED